MALSIRFVADQESCTDQIGDNMLTRMVVPFGARRRVFEGDKKLNPKTEWGKKYWDDDSPRICRLKKPLFSWMYDFISNVESTNRRPVITKTENDHLLFQRVDCGDLHWTFAYYLARSESEEAIRWSIPAWFVTIRDREESVVHPNWTIMFDYYGDISIKRGKATDDNPMSRDSFNFWENPEQRILDAIYSYVRLRAYRMGLLGK